MSKTIRFRVLESVKQNKGKSKKVEIFKIKKQADFNPDMVSSKFAYLLTK